ncbi:MAG: hypothetical protein AB7F64_00880 [Gammaproteobacteria bacterium]
MLGRLFGSSPRVAHHALRAPSNSGVFSRSVSTGASSSSGELKDATVNLVETVATGAGEGASSGGSSQGFNYDRFCSGVGAAAGLGSLMYAGLGFHGKSPSEEELAHFRAATTALEQANTNMGKMHSDFMNEHQRAKELAAENAALRARLEQAEKGIKGPSA